MKVLIALSLLVVAASAGTFHGMEPRLPVIPKMLTSELEGRITNGELAKAGQFKYQAGLMLQSDEQSFWCGGTIISDRYILTAAHCTDGADGVTVYLGAIDIKNENEKTQQRIYSSKSNIIIHSEWNRTTLSNDISIIKLPVKITFNDYIQPATLPKMDGKYSTYEGEMVWASGWGKDSDSATAVSPVLRFIEVPVLKQSTCSSYYLGMVINNMICISGKGGKSTCNGDSGGPLVKKEGDINYVIGATSFGISFGCEKGWPGVFTRVTAYLDWIEKTTGLANK